MITEVEKKIYARIDFSEKYLEIKKKYIDNGIDTPTFRVPEVKNIFKKISDHEYEYIGEGAHQLTKKLKQFDITYKFVISTNIVHVYMYVDFENKAVGPSETFINSVFRYITFNNNEMAIANEKFGFNSIGDLENYIHDFIMFCDDFVDEYIKEIEAGNVVV